MEAKEQEIGLWMPSEDNRFLVDHTVADLVKAHSLFLEIRHPNHHKQFQDRVNNDADAAAAEAVVFSWLRQQKLRPQIAESLSDGGADFLCEPEGKTPFVLEVTNLDRDAVERRSGWPDELDEAVRPFAMITPNLQSKARGKARQLGKGGAPRLLAISLAHIAGSALLGTLAAEWLMTSDPKIQVPLALDGDPQPSQNVTDFRKSAFLRLQGRNILPVRQSISAVLLIAVSKHQLETVGLLHPEPAVPFDYTILADVPFLRIEWPIKDDLIRKEWVIGHPSPSRYYHTKVELTDSDLKGE